MGNECRTLLYFEFYQSTRCPCISRVPSISRWLGVTGYFSIPFVLTRRQQRMYFWRAIVTMTYHFTRQRESGTLDSSRWREKQKKRKSQTAKTSRDSPGHNPHESNVYSRVFFHLPNSSQPFHLRVSFPIIHIYLKATLFLSHNFCLSILPTQQWQL